MPALVLHREVTATTARAIIGRLGGSIVQHHKASGNDAERYELTTLGILLTEDGSRLVELLARFVALCVTRFRSEPLATHIDGAEVEEVLMLRDGEAAQLKVVLQDHGSVPFYAWSVGGVAQTPEGWRVPMLYKVDEVAEETDFMAYVERVVVAHHDPECPADSDARSRYLSRRYSESQTSDELPFLAAGPLKRQLASDLREMEAVFAASAWKSCVILCGGMLEGLLYDELARMPEQATAAKAAPKERLERWGLEQLMGVAEELSVLRPATLSVSDAVRHYRNLIHPARLIAAPVLIDRHEAEIARGAVRVTLRELSARHST